MKDKRLLTSRQWDTADYKDLPRSWYAPRELLQRFKSVQYVELTNTTSSAGTWEGYFVQKLGKTSYVIPFSQDNNWPSAGFSLSTADNPVFEFEGEWDRDEITREFCELEP